jgi:hypothetical protein
MTLIAKVLTAAVIGVYGLFVVAIPDFQPGDPMVPTTLYEATTTHQNAPAATNPPNRTMTPSYPPAGACDAYVAIAYHVGWPQEALPTLREAMRRESGCNPNAVGDHGNSIGLLQIHQPSWCTPSSAWPIGWMQHYRLGSCSDLYNPIVNLRVGLAIYEGWTGSTPGWQHWHALP